VSPVFSEKWKNRLLRIPGAQLVKNHLLAQGHTQKEAETGGLVTAGLVLFLLGLAFNGFVAGVLRSFFKDAWDFCGENPNSAVMLGLLGTFLFLAVVFRLSQKSSEKKATEEFQKRQERQHIDEKRALLRKGAMGNFEEVFKYFFMEKYPEVEIKSIHVVDTVPRIRFQVRRVSGGVNQNADGNYQLFRETVLADTVRVIEEVFGLSENIPAVIVDAMMQFISKTAKFYDGAVLSVKAKREVFQGIDTKNLSAFKTLCSFDFRYHDGQEVKVHPEEESKNARIIERIKEKGPKLDLHYAAPRTQVDDGWVKTETKVEFVAPTENLRGNELSNMPLAQFQDLMAGLFGKLGFSVQKVKKVPGGTVQIMAQFSHPVLGGDFLILARQYPPGAPVHADLVRELDELTREEACKRGIYVVTGQFTEEARNISLKAAVDLVDGSKLAELLEGPPYEGQWSFRIVDEKGVLTGLDHMAILHFEQETDQFLKSLGFRVAKIRRASGGNVVAVAEHPHPVTGGKFAVLARQFPENQLMPPEAVSEFAHIMKAEFCLRGIFMATSEFSRESIALARFSGVELVDRHLWENLRRRTADS
jgi:restriction endonuclease Mrr